MNNKGFAITTMLYGTFILFLMLMLAMLGILNTFKDNMDKLIEGNNGARKIVELKCTKIIESKDSNKNAYSYKNGEFTDDYKGKIDTIAEFKVVLSLCGEEWDKDADTDTNSDMHTRP